MHCILLVMHGKWRGGPLEKTQRNVMDSISSRLRQLCVLSDDKCFEVCIRDFDMTLVWQISYSDKVGS